MATDVIMPKLGNSVESCIICAWRKTAGDMVDVGDILCEVETDKAIMEVESTTAGTLLALLYTVGDEVAVQVPIATVGEPGERASVSQDVAGTTPPARRKISPRARKLAQQLGISGETLDTIVGSGPNGRIVASDLETAQSQPQPKYASDSIGIGLPHPNPPHWEGDRLEKGQIEVPTRGPSLLGEARQGQPQKISPVAQAMVERSGYQAPAHGSGPKGRVMARDLRPQEDPSGARPANAVATSGTSKPLSHMRKIIAERMVHSLQSTAQLTLTTSADARAVLAYRTRLKASAAERELQGISLNALILFAVARTLVRFPQLNGDLTDDGLTTFDSIDLGFAVDTPRGLLVPVIPHAETLTLKQTAHEMNRLATACTSGKILPDDLDGGTFTVTNLGAFGIESFTPILNTPQIGILGIGSIVPKARWIDNVGGPTETIPQINLSLTIDHQAIDGAPAAKFLQALCQNLAEFELLLAQ